MDEIYLFSKKCATATEDSCVARRLGGKDRTVRRTLRQTLLLARHRIIAVRIAAAVLTRQ